MTTGMSARDLDQRNAAASSGRRSPSRRRRRRFTIGAVVLAIIAGFVVLLYQNPISQWGSTQAERDQAVAGDAVVPQPDIVWTRSITVDAPPEQVWPWLVQMGVDKGGFYNYDWGEQLFLDPVRNAARIHPEWQHLAPGDVIHPFPGQDWPVLVVETDRTLVLTNTARDWTWATELRPLGDDGTRVVTRLRGVKGSVFSYTLDVPDLILFPRLLTGLEQRAEGTLPSMPGTHVGRPFPLARLPVHAGAAVAWLVGLALFGALCGRMLGLGQWGRGRRHAGITAAIGFVAGAGYMLMSDTPPAQFFSSHWLAGLAVAVALGAVLARSAPTAGSDRAWLSRAVAAFTEAGLFIVLPATVVWQAATAQGWTTSLPGHAGVGTLAVVAAAAVATAAWHTGSARPHAAIAAAVLAVGYAVTGSGIVPLLGALVLEFGRRARTAQARHATAKTVRQEMRRYMSDGGATEPSPQPETSP